MTEKEKLSYEEHQQICSEIVDEMENLKFEEKAAESVHTTNVENSLISASSVDSSSVVSSVDLAKEFDWTSISTTSGASKIDTHSRDVRIQQNLSNSSDNVQRLKNMQIKNSSSVIIGNITYVTGPVYVTKTEGGNINLLNQTQIKIPKNEDITQNRNAPCEEPILQIINRKCWRARKPTEAYEYLTEPVPYVIISHTATEIPLTKEESIQFVRDIQTYHMNSRGWEDIGYNFLIGGCGYVYEGRGWGIIGAHTYGYNKRSIGISFIGCFMKELPPQVSLDACKQLINQGVKEGHIHPNYKLVAHCQCSATESPGRKLFDVIKTWPHFVIGSEI